jgi:hypothetical protein
MSNRRISLSLPLALLVLVVSGRSAYAGVTDGLKPPNPPPVNAGATVGSGPTASVTVHVPAGSGATAGPSGSSSHAGAASGKGNGSVASAPTQQSCVSCTNAQSSGGSSGASANEFTVFGNSFAGGQASGNDSTRDSIVAVDAGPIASAFIAPWIASSSSSNSNGASSAHADLATVRVGDQLATVAVLDAQSTAASHQDSTGSTGRGTGNTNAASADLLQGKFAVILVHTDSSSTGQGHAYVASLNGQQIGQSSNGTPITIPGGGTIELVPSSSSGGQTSSGGATAGDVGGQRGQVLGLYTADTAGAAAGPGTGAGTAGLNSTTPGVPVTGLLISGAALLLLALGFTLTGGAAFLRRRLR